jgi:hypothetical protein
MYSESMPLVEKEWGGRPLDLDARSDQRIGTRFSSPLRPQGRSCRERPAVDWQANIPHPYPVLYCGSHRHRRHPCLAVPR